MNLATMISPVHPPIPVRTDRHTDESLSIVNVWKKMFYCFELMVDVKILTHSFENFYWKLNLDIPNHLFIHFIDLVS